MSERTITTIDLEATIDAHDVVRGLKNNDDSILAFILQMLDHAGSSDLEEDLVMRVRDRLGLSEPVEVPT